MCVCVCVCLCVRMYVCECVCGFITNEAPRKGEGNLHVPKLLDIDIILMLIFYLYIKAFKRLKNCVMR